MSSCGGCQGLGSHRRWCQRAVGVIASRYGEAAEACERFGDMVGPNDMGLANALWAASSRLREHAVRHKESHKRGLL